MLELLRIRNLALIEDVELEFSPGLNTLTGETGAGKSFILRAVDFLMGERMEAKLVRPGAEKRPSKPCSYCPKAKPSFGANSLPKPDAAGYSSTTRSRHSPPSVTCGHGSWSTPASMDSRSSCHPHFRPRYSTPSCRTRRS